ncbi:MAG: prepilin-type N-terminal cleavage/methylation domain-containing protein [Vicinamibacteria bacterium]|nr:prepilin-type N-terminal cleavage/methylation domain-containing protein [Vicinamibacteria bacterium]
MMARLTTRMRSARGFTLMELLVVMSLIVVLTSIGLMAYRTSVQRGREAVLKEDLFRMRDAIDQFYVDKGKYPVDLSELVGSGYLRSVPADPMTNSVDSWQMIPAEPDPNNPSADIGVYNVKSGSDKLAIDGSSYSDW